MFPQHIERTLDLSTLVAIVWIVSGLIASLAAAYILRDR